MSSNSIQERIEAALSIGLVAQNGFVRSDRTVYMGSTGTVDVAALAEAVTAELGFEPEYARAWDALDGRRQHGTHGATYNDAVLNGSTIAPHPIEVRHCTAWEPAS